MSVAPLAGTAATIALAFAAVTLLSRGARGSSRWSGVLGNGPARWGMTFILAVALLAVLAPLVAPYPPERQLDIVALQNRPPSLSHPLGTDLYSRDVWSRLLHGGRLSLAIGGLGVLIAIVIGTTVGTVAGYWRLTVGTILMRLTDVGLAIPRIFILLALVAAFDRVSVPALILVIGLTSWFGTSRLVRAEVISVGQRPYVAAAQALGLRPTTLLFRHVLPNASAPIIISAVLGAGGVMLLEAGLSFLGFGVPAPMASWGSMIADGRNHLRVAPWAVLAPGLAIALVVMACSAIGESVRDTMAPTVGRGDPATH